MIVIPDSKRRLTLRRASPRDRFDVRITAKGRYVLTKLERAPRSPSSNVRIQKRGRYHVGVLNRPISAAALQQALAKYP